MAWETGKQKLHRQYKDINKDILEKEGFIEETEAKVLLYKFLRENPSFACELFTGVKLFPFQHMAIKAMMESDYFLGVWSRGMSKSFSTGVFALLDAILNQGMQIGILSKSFRQSKMIFKKTRSNFANVLFQHIRNNLERFMRGIYYKKMHILYGIIS